MVKVRTATTTAMVASTAIMDTTKATTATDAMGSTTQVMETIRATTTTMTTTTMVITTKGHRSAGQFARRSSANVKDMTCSTSLAANATRSRLRFAAAIGSAANNQ